MNDFVFALGFLMLLAASILILKAFGFKGAPVVVSLALVFFASEYSGKLGELLSLFSELEAVSGLGEYLSSALKIIGIGYLGGISSDVCRELGEGGVAKSITLVTRAELIAVTVPFLSELLELMLGIIGG